jgi:hypothetical protein
MSRKTDREQLVAQLTRELPDRSLGQVIELARKLSRAGATLQRLAEAQVYKPEVRREDIESGRERGIYVA